MFFTPLYLVTVDQQDQQFWAWSPLTYEYTSDQLEKVFSLEKGITHMEPLKVPCVYVGEGIDINVGC